MSLRLHDVIVYKLATGNVVGIAGRGLCGKEAEQLVTFWEMTFAGNAHATMIVNPDVYVVGDILPDVCEEYWQRG